MRKVIDLTGKRFGRLTVLSCIGHRDNILWWKCKCDCGNLIDIRGYCLRNHNTVSCGCLRGEKASQRAKERNTTHGLKNTRLYDTWHSMKARCYRETCENYPRYGGRGITVCEEWKSDFKAFYDWSMSHGYRDNLTIDRIDNDGDYEPSNCRWATQKEQANNQSSNHLLTYNGATHTIKQWSEILNISPWKLYNRVRYGWSVERTLGTP